MYAYLECESMQCESTLLASYIITSSFITGGQLNDESSFTVSTNDRRARVWRLHGERYADDNIVEVRWGLVVAWAEISLDGRTDMYVLVRGGITAAIHSSDILEPIGRPFAGVIGDAFILIQDNARAQIVP